MNYSKVLLLATIATFATVASVSAMERPNQDLIENPGQQANMSGVGENKATWLKKVSGSGDNNIVYVPNPKRTGNVNPRSQLQQKPLPTPVEVNTTKTTSIFTYKKQPKK